jgi:glucosamine--fructose-6-phosphate aminotransferase (isomerizing)
MCGIFGYVGPQECVEITLDGLQRLEYRGYDSAGIAGVRGGKIHLRKAVGKIDQLRNAVQKDRIELDLAIAHTRWATHGLVTVDNAHPFCDPSGQIALVHNGIIENHRQLRQGLDCRLEVDTEVIVQLIAAYYQGDLLEAVQKTIPKLQGSFAIAVIHRDHPDQIVVACRDMPLAVGLGEGESFVSSDTSAFLNHTNRVIFLNRSEVGLVRRDGIQVYNDRAVQVPKTSALLARQESDISKGPYPHFMLKEIFEQPDALRRAMHGRTSFEEGTARLDQLTWDDEELRSFERVIILACGTSYHAGLVAACLLEERTRIPVQVEISSEFRYKNPVLPNNSLVIAISQSGETADTLAAARELKAKGAKILAICNAPHSTLAREADCCLSLNAGPEIGVASTKAFTSQLTVLSLLALRLGRMRHMSRDEGRAFLEALYALPAQVEQVLASAPDIESIARRYCNYNNYFFVGRQYMFPTSLEGALKLKEISYINANGYPAGEMKHGPIALIDPSCPTVACCANRSTLPKLISNLMEIRARKGAIIAIAYEGATELAGIPQETIFVPETLDELAAIPTAVAMQLFAYYAARELGCEIDQPRNLAKSVTVE